MKLEILACFVIVIIIEVRSEACTPDRQYIGSYKCACVANSTGADEWWCIDNPELFDKGSCKSGTRKSIGYNKFVCDQHKKWKLHSIDGVPAKECTPGERETVGSDKCTCIESKLWFCPKKAGPGKECHDGQTKKLRCNDCSCGFGHWACTLKACSSFDRILNGTVNAKACHPGARQVIGSYECNCQDFLGPDWSCRYKAGLPNTACTPGARKVIGRYEYVCGNDKKWKCHSIEGLPCGECTPGERKKGGALKCFCNKSKRWVCPV